MPGREDNAFLGKRIAVNCHEFTLKNLMAKEGFPLLF